MTAAKPIIPSVFRPNPSGPDQNFRVWIELRCDKCRCQICMTPAETGPHEDVTRIPAAEIAAEARRMGAGRIKTAWVCVSCLTSMAERKKTKVFGLGNKGG